MLGYANLLLRLFQVQDTNLLRPYLFEPEIVTPGTQRVQHTEKHPFPGKMVAAFKFNPFIFALEFNRVTETPVNFQLQAVRAGWNMHFEHLAIFDAADFLIVQKNLV
jgi:hypothetical protein